MLDPKNTIIVIIDVQGKLAQLMDSSDKLFANLSILVRGAKLLNIPIVWMEQVPNKLGPTISEIKDILIDQEPIIKDVFSCVRNEEFNNQLKRLNPSDIVLAGIESHICVYQTAMDLLNNKHNVHIVSDAISSRTSANKELGIERMVIEGAIQTSVEMLLFEMQGNAKGERFRQISKLVR
tara:strand:+ start:793 stop:1332 length:540 start_codon:yes stop_codon:yes gene_type:complete